jgi:hypothetical protein
VDSDEITPVSSAFIQPLRCNIGVTERGVGNASNNLLSGGGRHTHTVVDPPQLVPPLPLLTADMPWSHAGGGHAHHWRGRVPRGRITCTRLARKVRDALWLERGRGL